MKVIMVAATTLCGRISPAPLGSVHDRQFLEKMRDETDASLMGSGTLRRQNPEMRGRKGVNKQRIRAFITLAADIPVAGKKVFCQGPAPIIFTGENHHVALASQLAGKAEVAVLSPWAEGLSLQGAIAELAQRGVQSLLIEGGAILNYHALVQQVVDEVCVTITPQLSGDSHAATLADGPHPLASPFLDLQLISCRAEENGEIFTRYTVHYKTKSSV